MDVRVFVIERDYMALHCVKAVFFVIACIVVASTSSFPGSSRNARRDKALEGIEACTKRNKVPSRECKNQNKNVQTLVDVYRQGDKTALPTLLQFTYLNEFFDEALVGDTQGFLLAVSHLHEPAQQAVASSVAGGILGLPLERFERVRATLKAVPDSSSNYQLARMCLLTLEDNNASFLIHYFPPQTFTGRAGDFRLHWYSRELYALEETPLWPPASGGEHTYRITVLPSFSVPESVTLTILADGSGQIEFRATDSRRLHLRVDNTSAISRQQVTDFTALLNRVQFWQSPTESPRLGFDGAEWILEGVQNGSYHVVDRWCPSKTPFGEAGQILFDLTGHKSRGNC